MEPGALFLSPGLSITPESIHAMEANPKGIDLNSAEFVGNTQISNGR
jgi:hypothetical protein